MIAYYITIKDSDFELSKLPKMFARFLSSNGETNFTFFTQSDQAAAEGWLLKKGIPYSTFYLDVNENDENEFEVK